MSKWKIEAIEKDIRFKAFLRRIWFHSFMEYFTLFGNDLEKRETAVERYLDTYKRKHAKN